MKHWSSKLMKYVDAEELYVEENCFFYKNKEYERLFCHPKNFEFRKIFSSSDYDYVENPLLIKLLRLVYERKRNV